MKIAFDVDVIRDLGITKMVHQVADWGYKYIEQSPHPQINPFYKHPKASRELITEYKNALRATGLEISSYIVVYRWSGPDAARRPAAADCCAFHLLQAAQRKPALPEDDRAPVPAVGAATFWSPTA